MIKVSYILCQIEIVIKIVVKLAISSFPYIVSRANMHIYIDVDGDVYERNI